MLDAYMSGGAIGAASVHPSPCTERERTRMASATSRSASSGTEIRQPDPSDRHNQDQRVDDEMSPAMVLIDADV